MCLFKPNTYDPKDWQCPKPSCRTVNFKKRTTCISCGARKPEGPHRPLDDWRDGEKNIAGPWDCDQCHAHNEAGAFYCIQCKKPSSEMTKMMEEEKSRRSTEEGRGGGLYDRQDPNDKKQWDSDGEEFDEFGRQKKKNEVLLLGQPMAWAPRQALLEQLSPDLKAAVDLATNPDLKAAVDLPTNTKQLSSV